MLTDWLSYLKNLRKISEKLLLPLLDTGGAFWGVCFPASSRAQKQSRDPSKLDLLNGRKASACATGGY